MFDQKTEITKAKQETIKRTPDEYISMAKTLLMEYEKAKAESKTELSPYEFLSPKMQDPLVASNILKSLAVFANQTLNKLEEKLADEPDTQALRDYLKTTHEILHQGLMVVQIAESVTYDNRAGKSSYQADYQAAGHAHVMLARGYHMARAYLSFDLSIQKSLKEYAMGHQKNVNSGGLRFVDSTFKIQKGDFSYDVIDDYLIAHHLIENAKENKRELTIYEKWKVHLRLNSAIKEKEAKGIDKKYQNLAKKALCDFLQETHVAYQQPKEIDKLYQTAVAFSKSTYDFPPVDVRFYRDNQKMITNICMEMQWFSTNLHRLGIKVAFPASLTNIFMYSPTTWLFSSPNHVGSDLIKAAQGLKQLIRFFTPYVEQYIGKLHVLYEEMHIKNSKQWTAISSLVSFYTYHLPRAIFWWELYASQLEKGVNKNQVNALVDFERLETLTHEYGMLRVHVDQFKHWGLLYADKVSAEEKPFFAEMRSSTEKLYSKAYDLPKNAQEVLRDIDTLYSRVLKAPHEVKGASSEFLRYMRILDGDLKDLKASIENVFSNDEVILSYLATANRELEKLVVDAKYEFSKIQPESLEKYLKTTHEHLNQCLILKEKKTPNAEIVKRMHAALARGYYVAHQVFKNGTYAELLRVHQKKMGLEKFYSSVDYVFLARSLVRNATKEKRDLTEQENQALHGYLTAAIDPRKIISEIDAHYAVFARNKLDEISQNIMNAAKDQSDISVPEQKTAPVVHVSTEAPKKEVSDQKSKSSPQKIAYLAATVILKTAEGQRRDLSLAEKCAVHKHLNAAIKHSDKLTDEDIVCASFAKSEFLRVFNIEEVVFEPDEANIDKLYVPAPQPNPANYGGSWFKRMLGIGDDSNVVNAVALKQDR